MDVPGSRIAMPGGILQRKLYELTKGQLQLKIVERMFPFAELFEAVATGKADIATVGINYQGDAYPWTVWSYYPGTYKVEDAVQGPMEEWAIYRDPRLVNLYDTWFREVGLVYLGSLSWAGTPRVLYSTKSVEKLADITGLKVRVPGAVPIKGWRALGGTPVNIALGEVAPALMGGTIDGVLTSLDFGMTQGWYGIAKNITEFPFASPYPSPLLVNAKAFDNLPPDLQQALRDVAKEMEDIVAIAQSTYAVSLVSQIERGGLKVAMLQDRAKAVEILKEIWDTEWLAKAGDRGQQLLEIAGDAITKYRAFEAFPK